VRLRNRWHELTHANANRRRANRNSEFHYALPPEFYKLWLDDPYLFYTCAYWGEGVRTLEEAQRAKADHVARKVLLKPGEEVVGSGGGFLMHAAMHYSVNITSINTTGSQAEHARRQSRSSASEPVQCTPTRAPRSKRRNKRSSSTRW
jgi:cyclopropane-fatty-acyl-phospholipid synthase